LKLKVAKVLYNSRGEEVWLILDVWRGPLVGRRGAEFSFGKVTALSLIHSRWIR
jgi:hypothetical protein